MSAASMAALEVTGLACARGGRAVFSGARFPPRRRPGAGAGRRQWRRQDLAPAHAGRLPDAAGRHHHASRPRAGGTIADAEERARAIGWLGHLDGIKLQLTARENLAFYAGLYGRPDADLVRALDDVGLARARDLPGQYLSAGMKKRLALARLKLSDAAAVADGRAPGRARCQGQGAGRRDDRANIAPMAAW